MPQLPRPLATPALPNRRTAPPAPLHAASTTPPPPSRPRGPQVERLVGCALALLQRHLQAQPFCLTLLNVGAANFKPQAGPSGPGGLRGPLDRLLQAQAQAGRHSAAQQLHQPATDGAALQHRMETGAAGPRATTEAAGSEGGSEGHDNEDWPDGWQLSPADCDDQREYAFGSTATAGQDVALLPQAVGSSHGAAAGLPSAPSSPAAGAAREGHRVCQLARQVLGP